VIRAIALELNLAACYSPGMNLRQLPTYRYIALIALFAFCAAGLAAGGGGEDPAALSGTENLRIGLMPAVDSAPVFLARDRGYFAEEGLELEIILFTNGQDRQSALQTRSIDGAMTDLVALAVNNDAGFVLKATTLTDGVFPILTAPGAMESGADGAALSVGTMEVSVTNFLVDRWLAAGRNLQKVWINAIPARLEAVASGQLDAGIFPEPFASVGAARGLERLVFDPPEGITPDVMAFTAATLETKARALEKFHRAYDRAVRDIIADPDLARDALLANLPNVDPALRELILLPEFSPSRLPADAYLEMIIAWTGDVVGRELGVVPGDLIDPRFAERMGD
jgi:NitT/TauT family transport system substrate-binding protein